MKFFIFEAWKRARTDEKKDERDEEGRTPDPTPWQAWTEKKALRGSPVSVASKRSVREAIFRFGSGTGKT